MGGVQVDYPLAAVARTAKAMNHQLQIIPTPDDYDPNVAEARLTGTGRLILHTQHGVVIIDIRETDVNAFAPYQPGLRRDFLLIPESQK